MDDQLVEYLFTCRNDDARLWLMELMETTREDEFVRILVTLWSIWGARRKAIHEQEFHSPLSTFRFVERYLEDLLLLPKKVTPNIVQPLKPLWDGRGEPGSNLEKAM